MARSRAKAVWLFVMRRRPLTEWLGGVPWRSILAIVFWEQALIRVVSVGTERLCWPRSGCARLRAGESAGPIGSMTWRRWMPPFFASFLCRPPDGACTDPSDDPSECPAVLRWSCCHQPRPRAALFVFILHDGSSVRSWGLPGGITADRLHAPTCQSACPFFIPARGWCRVDLIEEQAESQHEQSR